MTTGDPACTCPDWVQWHIPCKHFFCIFHLVEDWGWNSLPDTYTKSAYLCSDSKALLEHYKISQHSKVETNTEQGTSCENKAVDNPPQDVLPVQKVNYKLYLSSLKLILNVYRFQCHKLSEVYDSVYVLH